MSGVYAEKSSRCRSLDLQTEMPSVTKAAQEEPVRALLCFVRSAPVARVGYARD